MEVQKHSIHTLTFRSIKRGCEMFLKDGMADYEADPKATDILLKTKIQSDYRAVKDVVQNNPSKKRAIEAKGEMVAVDPSENDDGADLPYDEFPVGPSPAPAPEVTIPNNNNKALVVIGEHNMLVPRKAITSNKPIWHAPWKLSRVISGHGGWVRCVAVEPGNEWFATGSADRIIKIWDLYSGQLKLSLTGHISAVRGLAVGIHQPYLFSCGEDKQVKCWDLEYNKVIRHYHGHLSAVYGLDLHPALDFLVTCGRDSTARLWDMRTKVQIHCLTGHTNTVSQVRCQASEPQIITSSYDSTVRLWDIVAGKTRATLTNHKRSVRALVLHPNLNMMATGSPDNLKQWSFPDGVFIQNMSGHNAIINSLAVNSDNVLVSGGDNGSLYFWDWSSAHNFQRLHSAVQPGSIDSEAGILAMTFDRSDSRLITCESDKTIKVYVEDQNATEESHPLNWKSKVVHESF